jgi:succinate dehydrogenase / fumarate reductase iron-sulfur subunit
MPSTDTLTVTLRVKRYNPEVDRKPHWQSFVIEGMESTDRVLDALHQAKWFHDGTLTFRRSCAHGVCGSDAMMVNGENALACQVLLADAGTDITVEAIRGLTVIKDLVVDMAPFFAQYRSVLPWLIAGPGDPGYGERRQSPEQRERFDDTTKCILCAACTTSCPVFWTNGSYVGPAAIVQAHRFLFDSRDEGGADRLDVLGDRTGVWRCRTAFNCTNACPRGIKVTQAIQEVKRKILTDQV